MPQVFLLLVLFQFKHLIADYFLQGKYMLKKFLPGWDFFVPLLAHVGVHGSFTLTVLLVCAPKLWWVCLVDMSIHFAMDRIKAGPKYLGRFKPLTPKGFKKDLDVSMHADDKKMQDQAKSRLRGNTWFWWSLGIDQMVHHLTDILIIYMIVSL